MRDSFYCMQHGCKVTRLKLTHEFHLLPNVSSPGFLIYDRLQSKSRKWWQDVKGVKKRKGGTFPPTFYSIKKVFPVAPWVPINISVEKHWKSLFEKDVFIFLCNLEIWNVEIWCNSWQLSFSFTSTFAHFSHATHNQNTFKNLEMPAIICYNVYAYFIWVVGIPDLIGHSSQQYSSSLLHQLPFANKWQGLF